MRMRHEESGTAARARTVVRAAFTLIELLVVIAVTALLIAILLPSLSRGRMQARMVAVHSDLRQITLALDAYLLAWKDRTPPMRCGCDADVEYQLPVELVHERFLPRASGAVPQADFRDRFDGSRGYKYKAPGPQFLNGTLNEDWENSSAQFGKVWVPDDFPRNESAAGQYYCNESNATRYRRVRGKLVEYPPSPVRYAVWSMGPDAVSSKYPRTLGSNGRPIVTEALLPLPRAYWMRRASETGLITHFRARSGLVYQSP